MKNFSIFGNMAVRVLALGAVISAAIIGLVYFNSSGEINLAGEYVRESIDKAIEETQNTFEAPAINVSKEEIVPVPETELKIVPQDVILDADVLIEGS